MTGRGRVPRPKNREKTGESHIILDALLLPRLQQYAYNHSPLRLDSCIDYLRRNYREYSRKQQAPFRKLVHRAIHILQKRSPLRTPRQRATELKLQQQEEAHSLRRREQASSAEDDSTSSSVDREDCSDGDELEKGSFISDAGIVEARSDGGGEQEEGTHSAGSSERGGFDKEQIRRKRKTDRASGKGRKKRKAEYGSDSAWEDEALGASPAFNLLNSSLRTTYHGRPAVFLDAEAPSEVQTPEAPSEVLAPCPKAHQAFAPPSVIAAAAKAASKALKKQSNQGETADITERAAFIEGGVPEVGDYANQDGITVSKRLEEHIKFGSANQMLEGVKQAGKGAETGNAGRQICSKAERPGHKRRSKASDKQLKEPSTTSAEVVRFSDLGGIDSVLEIIREMTFPLYNPGVYSWLGLQPIGGILLHGPPGCGKTKLANAIAYETGLPFLKISAPEVVSGMSGESEAKVRGLFTEASRLAPCIVFIDEIDAITSKRESANREMERRIVTQLMTCMDELSQSFQKPSSTGGTTMPSKGHVLVIGATNRPEALDPALRRPGRFDREVSLSIPDENGRMQILSVLAKNLRLEGSFDFKHLAKCTPGFVGADLAALTREAGSIAIKRIVSSRDPYPALSLNCGSTTSMLDEGEFEGQVLNSFATPRERGIVDSVKNGVTWWKLPWTQKEMHALSITMQDFEVAMKVVQPSTKREGFSAIPDVKWEDVGALDSVQKNMEFFISRRIKHPEDYEALGLDMDTGFLLYGPPGCGKTLVAKAVANDAQANFIYIKGPELLNKYVGESELAVRALFSRARSCSPCILFFDEMDALAPRRGTDGNAVAERVLNQLLSEMDGAEKRKGVFIIGATNRPDMIDPAVLRPGRLGKLLFVPLPDSEGRLSILKTLIRRKPISPDVNLASIASNKSCEGLSGADLAALVNEACVAALQERSSSCSAANYGEQDEPILVSTRHFDIAQSQILPSVSKQDLLYYEALPRKFSRTSGLKGIPSETFL